MAGGDDSDSDQNMDSFLKQKKHATISQFSQISVQGHEIKNVHKSVENLNFE